MEWEMQPVELARRLREGPSVRLLDVRTPGERGVALISPSEFIPMQELPGRLAEVENDPNTTWVVYCHHGVRSLRVVAYLRQNGIANALSLAGGIDAWSQTVDPAVPRY